MHEMFIIIDEFVSWLVKQGFSTNTVENYKRGVVMFAEFLQSIGMDFYCGIRGIEKWKDTLNMNNRTINLYLHGVRKLYFYMNYMGISSLNPKHILLLRETRKEAEYITKSEYKGFLEIDDSSIKNLRNTVIVRILRETGLRVSELTSLRWDGIKEENNDLYYKIIGKGNKERIIRFSKDLKQLLLHFRFMIMEEDIDTDYVVCSFSRNSLGRRLSRNTIEKVIRNLNKTDKRITPHSFRHGMATYCLQHGGNIVDLQKTLGHANVSITSNYLHSDSGRVKDCQKIVW